MRLTTDEKLGRARRKRNAEKQARYRYRALKDPDGLLLTRVAVLVGPRAAADLKRIRKRTGWTLRETVERAVKLLDADTRGQKKGGNSNSTTSSTETTLCK